MRIGYLYDMQAYPPRGGNHVHAGELIQGFLAFGHTVAVVDDPTMPGVTNYGNSDRELAAFIADIDVLYVRIDARFIGAWSTLIHCLEHSAELPVVWEINSPANESLAYSWLSGRQASGRESLLRRMRRWQHATRKQPGIFFEERVRRRLARRVSVAICVSSSLGRYASEGLGIDNVLVLPNGGPLISKSEIEERRGRNSRDGFTVLYSGSAIYPWQGLDYLSEVIALAAREAPDLTFVLAVNKKKGTLPDSDNVVVLEHLDRQKILDAICGADACVSVHPEYTWSKYGFHNSPMKLFEYMACARPSVASRHGQMLEIIRDDQDGLLCANDPKDILGKLLYLRDNPDQALKIGENAWHRVQSELNWKANVEKTLRVFEQVLQ